MTYKADLLDDLKSLGYCAKYLRAAMADSVEAFLVALRDVAEAQQGMTRLSSAAGVNRENLYRMLSGQGNPRLNNLKAVLDAIGLQIDFVPAKKRALPDRTAAAVHRHAVSASETLAPGQASCSSIPAGGFIADVGSIRTVTCSGGQGTTMQPWGAPLKVTEGRHERAYSHLPGFLNQSSAKPSVALSR